MPVPSVANVPAQPLIPEQAIYAHRESRAESTVGTDQSEQRGESESCDRGELADVDLASAGIDVSGSDFTAAAGSSVSARSEMRRGARDKKSWTL